MKMKVLLVALLAVFLLASCDVLGDDSNVELFDGRVTVYGFPAEKLNVGDWATFIVKTNLGNPGTDREWRLFFFPDDVANKGVSVMVNTWATTGNGSGIKSSGKPLDENLDDAAGTTNTWRVELYKKITSTGDYDDSYAETDYFNHKVTWE